MVGESIIDAAIKDGDSVVVRQQKRAENAEILGKVVTVLRSL